MNESEDNECKAIQDELHEINKKLDKLEGIEEQLEQSQKNNMYTSFCTMGLAFAAIGIAIWLAPDRIGSFVSTGLFLTVAGLFIAAPGLCFFFKQIFRRRKQ
ncbi:MAG: hypothetical protein ACLFVK_05215 [Dehalococcoidia bacterium]